MTKMESMNKLHGFIFICFVFLAACAPSYSVRTTNNEFDGYTRYQSEGNVLSGGCIYCSRVELNIVNFKYKDGRELNYLLAEYNSTDWLFLSRDGELKLLVDGELHNSLPKFDPVSDVLYGGRVYESAMYPISADFLKTLSQAKEIKIQLYGRDVYVEREFAEENFSNWKKFVGEYYGGS